MTKTEQIRLYLRDKPNAQGKSRFSDEDIAELLVLNNDSIFGAAALGWLLTAAEMSDAAVSASIGNTSESYGQPTERYKISLAMHQYWKAQFDKEQGSPYGGGLWWEMVPDYADGTEGIISELIEHRQYLRDNWIAA